MDTYPKISVIVPAYNAAKTIKKCIESIAACNYPDFEIIAVDDASSDNTKEILAGLPCKLITLDRNCGPGMARNKGVEIASGEILSFTDSDCQVPPNWLERIANAFKNHNLGAVSGGYSNSVGRGLIELFQFYDTAFRQRNISQYIDSCISSNFSCKKQTFNEIGGFPQLRIGEDMEFGRILSNRCKILWDKNNGVAHQFNNSLTRYFHENILWSESAVKSYLSHPKFMSKKSTWNNSEILTHILIVALLYLSLALSFWYPISLIIFFVLIALYGLINTAFIKFVDRKENYIFSFKLLPLLFVRNSAWLLGVFKATALKIFTLMNSLKK